jgi:ketosteroid isomerase-like protein
VKRLILIPLLVLAACSKTPDEQLIRNAIDEMEAAVQQRQTKPVLKHLARDFVGPEGMTVRQVRRLMAAHYFRNKNINVVLAGMRVQIMGNDASVMFNAAVTGGAGMLPERLQYYDVKTIWRKLDGDWRIIRADWAPAGRG